MLGFIALIRPQALSRSVHPPTVREAAVAVLRGERHPLIGNAQFFHAASYRARYDNMHYVLTTGGNAFYERRRPELVTQPVPRPTIEGLTRRSR